MSKPSASDHPLFHCFYQSPVGPLLLVSDGVHLTGLWTPKQTPTHLTPEYNPDLPVFQATRLWLDLYFAGENPDCAEILLKPTGTPFQQLIWKLLLQIPYGTTATYGDLAQQAATILEKPTMSAQAVGQAVGRNPISILIPCHRVLGANGTLTGYAGGLEVKSFLLNLESTQLRT